MKKIYMIIACLVLALLTAGIVVAETPASQSGQTLVTYGSQESYQLVVPTDVVLSKGEAVYRSLQISNARLGYGNQVTVTVDSDNYNSSATGDEPKWRLKHSDQALYVPYHFHLMESLENLIEGGAVTNTDPVLTALASEFTTSASVKRVDLKFFIDSEIDEQYAGSYSDTLTFTAAVSAVSS